MKRGKWKEAILLCLPVVAVLLAAAWWQQKEQRAAVLEKRIAILNSGPLRLEVEKIEKVVPTPAEVAEGYDAKYVISFAKRGENPFPFPKPLRNNWGNGVFAENIKFETLENNTWRDITTKDSSCIKIMNHLLYRMIPENQLVVVLSLAKLPRKELRLRYLAKSWFDVLAPQGSARPIPGKVRLMRSRTPGTNAVIITSSSVPQTLIVRKLGELAPLPEVSRDSSLTLKTAKVIRWTPAHAMGFDGHSGADTGLDIELQRRVVDDERTRHVWWRFIDMHVVDETGKKYKVWRSRYHDRWDRSFGFNIGSDGYPSRLMVRKDDIYRFEGHFSLAEIPTSAGQLTFKGWVSVNEKWPLSLSIVVRKRQSEDWMLRKSKTLILDAVKATQHPSDKMKFYVWVSLKYNGGKQLIECPTDGSSRKGRFFFDHIHRGFFESGVAYTDSLIDKTTPQQRMLVTDWSQRIEDGSKNSVTGSPVLPLWGSLGGSYIANPARVKEVLGGTVDRSWTVTYEIDLRKLRKRSKKILFKADIGVEGDGFLPISIALPQAATPKTVISPRP